MVPIPFTMEATHEGPEPSVTLLWSDSRMLGITKLTCLSEQFLMSLRIWDGLGTIRPFDAPFVQYGPVHTPFFAVQMD